METIPHVTFSLNQSLYAVPTCNVQEIVTLPELTPIVEMPVHVVGVINLRGTIVPVTDLNILLYRTRRRYRLSDTVIVLEVDGRLMGIIVDEVHDAQTIPADSIEPAPFLEGNGHSRARFINSLAKGDEQIVLLLNCEALIRSPATERLLPADLLSGSPPTNGDRGEPAAGKAGTSFFTELEAEQRAVFQERAKHLMRSTEGKDTDTLSPLAVVGLNGEYFGVELEVVREFADILNVTPVPCCPHHIVGDMNLRGDILTLVDIREKLGMPFDGLHQAAKAMVVTVHDLHVGILVDQVFDVVDLRPADITTVPVTVKSGDQEFIKGTTRYGEKMLSILDLPQILLKGDLVVNEEV